MIEVTVKCVNLGNDDSSHITGQQPETDWRQCNISIDWIGAIHETKDKKETLIYFSPNDSWTVKQTRERVLKLIEKAKAERALMKLDNI